MNKSNPQGHLRLKGINTVMAILTAVSALFIVLYVVIPSRVFFLYMGGLFAVLTGLLFLLKLVECKFEKFIDNYDKGN